MSQQLIIQNDEDEDYVQFTVEIPDGYAGFNISSINGTMINQNYLNIGDVLRFKFSNNPIVYKQPIDLYISDMSTPEDLKTSHLDTFGDYKFIELNMFNIYRVKFIPVYSYYNTDSNFSAYVFNPADDSDETNQLLDEPTRILKDYEIQSNPPIRCPFTGQFVIGLEKVDKIDDIDVVIGQSISNSKTQPTDITLNEAGEAIAQNQQGTTYNYGSYWRYNVANLLMNHRMSVINGIKVIDNVKLCYTVKGNEDKEYTTPYYGFNNTRIASSFRLRDINGDIWRASPTFKFYTFTEPSTLAPLANSYLLTKANPSIKYIVHKNGPKYEEIKYDSSATGERKKYIPDGLYLKGSDIDLSYYEMDLNDLSQPPQQLSMPIMTDAYYTGNSVKIRIRPVQPNKTITFNYVIYPGGYKIIRCDGQTPYNVHVEEDNIDIDVVCLEINDKGRAAASRNRYLLGESIKLDDSSNYTFIHTINTGFIDLTTFEGNLRLIEVATNNEEEEEEPEEEDINDINTAKYMTQRLQLTSLFNGQVVPADDDIIIKRVVNDDDDDGLQLKMNKLTNNMYIILYDQNDKPYTEIAATLGANDVEPKVFLPKKSNIEIRAFNNGNNSVKDGLMRIDGIDGLPLEELTDESCSLFLATGHESLNVEQPKDDDLKFKTFNGSITFDRSLTKITRLFSMSNSNSCIGYINDILSARLSRYYFAANYSIFNTFINNVSTMPFTNSLNQNEVIFNKYGDKLYTGCHEVLLANCGDIVKLIGSDVITNNCMPGITPEEHVITCQDVTNNVDDLTQLKNQISLDNFYYKIFHYYNSGFNHFPSVGGDSDIPNGCSLLKVDNKLFFEKDDEFTNDVDIDTHNMFCITNKVLANNAFNYPDSQLSHIKSGIISSACYHNNLLVNWYGKVIEPTPEEEEDQPEYDNHFGGIINVLPCPRVYRNNNFEQSDLTISTGRIKTLSPIYIQSVNRVLLNNIIYMFDMMINLIVAKYGSIKNTSEIFDYLTCLRNNPYGLLLNQEAPLRRFSMKSIETIGYYPLSFDSCWLMNYLVVSSVNEYTDNNELAESLPTAKNEANNEEIIENIITYRPETNIQLFSSRYFNFHENISILSTVCWVQVINSSLDLNTKNCWMYFGKNENESSDDPSYSAITSYIDNFYSNVLLNNSYNICRTVKTMISKLGEFLDFPKIVFGATLAFNQSKTVNIQYINPVNYASEFQSTPKIDDETKTLIGYEENYYPNQKQKNNVAMFGVIFKYHQLSLGWQQMINDLQETFVISRAKGQKHFVVKIYDEFGRQIPNMDTSQGFKNNLRLEINCFNG